MTETHRRRLQLGEAAILTVQQAADLLPRARSIELAWLRSVEGLSFDHLGAECVVWGDVLRAARAARERAETAPARPRLVLPEPVSLE